MSWKLEGSYFETCSCELMCPCNLTMDHGATYDYCRATLVFKIREGEIEGTDVAGLSAIVIADTPKVMTDGNWRLGILVDAEASDEQAEKLGQVFGGQLGGPMGGVAPLVGERLGVERVPIEVRETASGTPSAPAMRSSSRSRTSCPSAPRTASPSGSTECFTPWDPI
jgi:hypothetical protein